MSSNAFNQSEREYNAAEERRGIGKAERRSIADSAIYQHTAQMAEKYKVQRDELLIALKNVAAKIKTADYVMARSDAMVAIAEAEQSL